MSKDNLPQDPSEKCSSALIFNPRKFLSLELVFQEEQNSNEFIQWMNDSIWNEDFMVLSNF